MSPSSYGSAAHGWNLYQALLIQTQTACLRLLQLDVFNTNALSDLPSCYDNNLVSERLVVSQDCREPSVVANIES